MTLMTLINDTVCPIMLIISKAFVPTWLAEDPSQKTQNI